ncbi:MAG: NusG domain II-containing protein [Gammaproteobacteria bacterium]|nr:NusG domain II-containing protein [Gammaproteobacteria bacterium]
MKTALTLIKGLLLFKPADIIILISAGLLTFWLYSVFWFDSTHQGDADRLLVQFADNPPVEYSLNKEQIINIKGNIGPTLIEIKQGKARFIHSSCRNQFCVFHGWLTVPGDTTACLPNRISISLKGTSSEYDAIAGAQ